ncbi:unnamed protein product [Allacma fusca]|uniref:Uncharacterized protein n=1 Tax=Allacma fusca TaxID=39272 RepID=A0A8J2KV42_9HEXA|nr:unnamed protein product [Allacma fusca]
MKYSVGTEEIRTREIWRKQLYLEFLVWRNPQAWKDNLHLQSRSALRKKASGSTEIQELLVDEERVVKEAPRFIFIFSKFGWQSNTPCSFNP